MDIREFRDLVTSGRPIEPGTPAQAFMRAVCQETTRLAIELNTVYHTPDEVRRIFSQIIGEPVDDSFLLFPPFNVDFGRDTHVGAGVLVNSGCFFQDQGGITLEDGVLIGQRVTIATVNHPMNAQQRANLLPKPVRICKNAWIGSCATICPGVTVGEGAVVAAGAVVPKDVPPLTVVGGVPAKTIREIQPGE